MNVVIKKRNHTSLLYLFLGAMVALFFMSCSKDEDGTPAGKKEYTGIPKIILDVDVASSTDDLFALQMAYRYAHEGRCEMLGVVVDRLGEVNAVCADVMNTFFGYGHLPLALGRNGIKNPTVWIDYSELPNYADADGKPYFSRTYSDYSQLPDGWQLYRKLLASQPDHSVTICSVGFLTCLSQLLDSQGDEYSPLNGVELVRKKVKIIYVMGGILGSSIEDDYNFAQGMVYAENFFRKWPSDVDIMISPCEVGNGIEYKGTQVISDISWTDVHPIKQVYMRCNTNTGQKMWDPMVVINAVEGDSQFNISQRGSLRLSDDAVLIFTASDTGNCRYQIPGDAAWCDKMLQKIRQSVMALR